ncbi:hypothetical protein G9P44_005041 [Scheffersomyces stipitis]|nr:hypothetical protein G9P44_005041 [Scheffersomyces stipitis]
MDYDEDYDKYSDHDEEEFNEDSLPNDEYDKLHELLPQLIKTLASYNDEVPELDLKEALYYNYYDLDAAADEIRSKFKKSTYDFAISRSSSGFFVFTTNFF